ncbi:alpha/beta hydrolase [Shimia sp.]|uniref:alpha/beta fold hydrolase n=1 Tax=Shimia sp. TaxID=1954381 RepID=UPI0032969F41
MASKTLIFIAFVVALGVAWTFHRARQQEHNAQQSYPPEGEVLSVDGHPVHAVVLGSGPDLVLIHGSSGNTRDFTHSLAGQLSDRYRVIIFDRPGLGYTPRINSTGATIQQQASLLSKAARQLGATRPIVLGQSYGGAVALAWAVHEPDNIAALIVLAGVSQPWTTPLSNFYRVTSHPILGPAVIPFLTAYVDDARVSREIAAIFNPQSAPAGYIDYVGAGLTLRRSSLRANAVQRHNLLNEIKSLQPHYPEITVPTEILHGDADTTVGLEIHARPLSQTVPGSVLTVLPGIGHMPQHTAQPQVLAAIDRAAVRAGLH